MSSVAFACYLLFMTSWFLHLPARVPVLGALRFDLILVVITLMSTLAGGISVARSAADRRIQRILMILFVYVLVTLPLVEWPGTVLKFGLEAFAKAALFYFFTSQLCTTERRLKVLMVVFLACQTFRVVEPLYLHETQGYWGSRASVSQGEDSILRLAGAPSDVINPNGLAFVILTVLSFSHFLSSGVLGRTLYIATLPLHLYTMVLTSSRSGFAGLIAVYGAVWWQSRRKVAMAVILAIVGVAGASRLGPDTLDRYMSIFSSNTRNAGTAAGRSEFLHEAMTVAKRRPLFGHGLTTSREANANFGFRDQPAHNLYAETAQELGFIGMGILIWLIVSIYRGTRQTLASLKAAQHKTAFLLNMTLSLRVFLAMNLLFSFASYGLTSYEWYFMAGLSSALLRLIAVADQPVVASDRGLAWSGAGRLAR